jgi:hypothetical protein
MKMHPNNAEARSLVLLDHRETIVSSLYLIRIIYWKMALWHISMDRGEGVWGGGYMHGAASSSAKNPIRVLIFL